MEAMGALGEVLEQQVMQVRQVMQGRQEPEEKLVIGICAQIVLAGVHMDVVELCALQLTSTDQGVAQAEEPGDRLAGA
jgi:hypothetical protein